jgi:UDP-apiose/xylose synthase
MRSRSVPASVGGGSRLRAAIQKGIGRMKILCLGAGGFIGSHLASRLLDEGHRVIGVDTQHDKIQEFSSAPGFEFINKNIGDPSLDSEGLVRTSDLVIDLIAYANPSIYLKSPLDVFRLNFTENLRIAEFCVKHQKRLIQFSTCEVYGKTPAAILPGRLPDPENPVYAVFSEDKSDCILGPINKHRWIYASAKQLLERVLHAYGLEGRLNYTIIRPFNFIGPRIDYLPIEGDGIPRVFSCFMAALLKGTPMQLVDGGAHRRSYTYIDDAIDGIYRIVQNPGGVCDREIFNIGSSQNEVSIQELAEQMRAIYRDRFQKPGVPLSPIVSVTGQEFYGEGYEDCDRRIPDCSKAHNLLGWEPRIGISELLDRTMSYYAEPAENRAPAPL